MKIKGYRVRIKKVIDPKESGVKIPKAMPVRPSYGQLQEEAIVVQDLGDRDIFAILFFNEDVVGIHRMQIANYVESIKNSAGEQMLELSGETERLLAIAQEKINCALQETPVNF